MVFSRNVDYIVQDDQIVIVDEHTGRTMPGRRWSEGIHQAIEAKESITIQKESQTMASTTFQNYFRLYQTLAGMTGTADTEAFELHQIYESFYEIERLCNYFTEHKLLKPFDIDNKLVKQTSCLKQWIETKFQLDKNIE